MKLEFELAQKLIRESKKMRLKSVRFKTAFLGIFLASLGLFLGSALLGGHHQMFKNAVLKFNAHLILKSHQGYLSLEDQIYLEDTLKILHNNYPHAITPFLYQEAMIQTEQGFQAAILKGVRFKDLNQIYTFPIQEYIINPEPKDRVFLGFNLIQKNPDFKRDEVSFLYWTEEGIKSNRFEVAGIFQTGIEPYDSEFVLMDLAVLQKMFLSGAKPRVMGYEIKLHNEAHIPELAQALRALLKDELSLQTWEELNFSLLDGLKLEKKTFTFVGIFILMVACLNILGFNLMFFLQNKDDFLVLWHLGFAQKRIGRLLLGLSLFIGLSAILVAAVVSYLLVIYLSFGDGLMINLKDLPPVRLLAVWNSDLVVVYCVVAVLVCALSSFGASRSLFKR